MKRRLNFEGVTSNLVLKANQSNDQIEKKKKKKKKNIMSRLHHGR